MSADAFFQKLWYDRSTNLLSLLFVPLSWVFGGILALRQMAFRLNLIKRQQVSRPVIVVGNITVGGTGKTPLTLWLAEQLGEKGFTPGIVLRGYRGAAPSWPCDVTPASNPVQVGDEAVLLATRSRGIVVAGPDRVAAARRAIERGADVILADDGLQHHQLGRDVELAVVDAGRGIGNGRLLPAGPLREGASRLRQVDAVLIRNSGLTTAVPDWLAAAGSHAPVVSFSISSSGVRSLKSGQQCGLDYFKGQSVHAIAGTGNPEGFFATLRNVGIHVTAHALPDHAAISAADLDFGDAVPVLMTEKDAVKCGGIDDPRLWAVAAHADLDATQAAKLMSIIETRLSAFRTPPLIADR